MKKYKLLKDSPDAVEENEDWFADCSNTEQGCSQIKFVIISDVDGELKKTEFVGDKLNIAEYKKWNEAEQRTGTWVIFKLIE